MSYEYVISTKRISLPRDEETNGRLERARRKFPAVLFVARDSSKRTQVIMEVKRSNWPDRSGKWLDQATKFLRQN